MKKLISYLLAALIITSCAGQGGTFSSVNARNSLMVAGKKVTSISNDSSETSKSTSKLITERAAKLYADSRAGGSGAAWTATALGILHDGSNQTTNLQNALDNDAVKTIWFESSSAADYVISGTVTVPAGKVLRFEAGNKLKGSGTLNGGIIDASYYAQVFDTTLTVNIEGSSTGKVSAAWFGANPSLTDNYTHLQKAINNTENKKHDWLVIPQGTYNYSKGLLVSNEAGGVFNQCKITMEGLGNAYTEGPMDVVLNLTVKTGFGLGVQLGKNCTFQNLVITGQNTAPDTVNLKEMANCAAGGGAYVTSGCSDLDANPYAGFVIDPFGTSSVTNKYSGFTSKYFASGGSGSSDIKVYNCNIHNFVDNIAISPNGTQQNSESLIFDRIWSNRCKNTMSIGNSQTDVIVVSNYRSWGNSWCGFNGYDRGFHLSTLPHLQGGINFAGGTKYFCKTSSWYDKFYISGVHAELIWAFGGFFGSSDGGYISVQNSAFHFMNTQDYGSSEGGVVERAPVIASCNNFEIQNTFFDLLGSSSKPPLVFNCNIVNVKNAVIDQPFISAKQDNSTQFNYFGQEIYGRNNIEKYSPVDYGVISKVSPTYGFKFIQTGVNNYLTAYKMEREYVGTGIRNEVVMGSAFSYTGKVNGIANFSVIYNEERIAIGDYLLGTYSGFTNELGGDQFIFGRVASINRTAKTGTIEVLPQGTPTSTTAVNASIVWIDKLAKNGLMVGNVTNGSRIITNIKSEGGIGQTFEIGDRIDNPNFVPGVSVDSILSTTSVRVTANAVATETGSAMGQGMSFLKSKYMSLDLLSDLDDGGARFVFRRGDIIYNNMNTSTYGDVVLKFCTKDGITNAGVGVQKPTFKTVTAL